MKRIVSLALAVVMVVMMLCFSVLTCGAETAATDAQTDTQPVETTGAETAVPETTVSEEEDLGGAFSPARLAYAGRMTLLGMGMVFAVLAVLWLILAIFEKAAKGKSKKKEEPKAVPAEAPAPTPVVEEPAEEGTDGATIAAITAAVAAMIASDETLSSQFANGFRVVSFKKKNGKTSWNR